MDKFTFLGNIFILGGDRLTLTMDSSTLAATDFLGGGAPEEFRF